MKAKHDYADLARQLNANYSGADIEDGVSICATLSRYFGIELTLKEVENVEAELDKLEEPVPKREVWYTYRINEKEESGAYRLLVPYSDPRVYETTFDLIWTTANEAKEKMRVWVALNAGLPDDEGQFEDAEYETAAAWYEELPEASRVVLDNEMNKLILVELSITPIQPAFW
jgi:hypothetical protein